MSNQPIYLDYNSTTPVDERVMEVMLPYFTQKFGNAASIQHAYGWDSEEAVNTSRDQIAFLLGAKSQSFVFTSGATEGINLVMQGAVEKSEQKKHIITSKTEHKAVLDTCEYLSSKGVDITYLGVNRDGLVDFSELEAAINDQTLMVSLMSANNETGVLQDIKKIGEICKAKGVLFFSDITQSAGKIESDLDQLNLDFAVLSSHKLYGPKGVGALYAKDLSLISPQVFGGGHEKGIRSGTLNVPGIVGFGKACYLSRGGMNEEGSRLKILRDMLENELSSLGGVIINGKEADRLPHVSNITFQQIDGSKLMRSLKGLAVSQGSACNSAVIEPSHVLTSMGHSSELAYSSIRFSLGRFTTEAEIKETVQIVRNSVEQLRMQLQ